MGRMIALSYKPYRNHRLELRDAGGTDCSVIIHPPHGRGTPQEVVGPLDQPPSLGVLIARAKDMIDVVLGPRPPIPFRPGYPARRPG